jgi:hypothetical protein
VVGRNKQRTAARPTFTVHQIVAYNFRRAREEKGWTQAQTSDQLEPFLGYRLNQAGVSAIEKTFDSERRRNIDVSEVVAFSRCFLRPIGWFFLPPPGTGADLVEPTSDDRYNFYAADLATLVVGGPTGWDSFLDRITELLKTDSDEMWTAMQAAFSGIKRTTWEKQIDLRRRALQQVTMARFAGPEDEVITGMASLLVELVKSTPLGMLKLRDKDPDEALELLAEGDRLVQPLIDKQRNFRDAGMSSQGTFADVADIDLAEALRQADQEE